jgi:hypothetical protein
MSNYSVRIRGREHGPFSLAKIRELVRKGQVGRMHEVSTDGVSWLAASSYAELFGKDEAPAVAEMPSAGRATASTTSRGPNAPPQIAAGEWYYSDGAGSEGPFGLAEIQRLASQGVIHPADHVWDPGKSAWTEAASIPSLDLNSRGARQAPSMAYTATESGAGQSQAAWALKSSAGWKLFIALWCLVVGVLSVVGGLVLLSRAGGVEPVIASAIGTIASGIYLLLVGGFLLAAYAAVTAAAANPRDEVIATAIRAENRAWVAFALALLLATLGSILFAIVFNNPSLS